jgi:CBS domain-containing protein
VDVRSLMTNQPTCCTPDTPLRKIAQLMKEHDCGEIPIIDNFENKRPVGVITDRDIAIRTLAEGKNPLDLTANDAMTSPAITVKAGANLADAIDLMESNQIRRIPVVDDQGRVTGIVSQADLALHSRKELVGEVLEHVSRRH